MQKTLFLCFVLWSLVSSDGGCTGGACEPPRWVEGRQRGHRVFVPRSYVTLTAAKGTPVYMRCRAQGNPKPRIQWFKNGTRFSRKHHHMGFHRKTLKFNRVKIADTGNYTCQVSNEYGAISRHFYLTVLGLPIRQKLFLLNGYPRNVTAFVGQPAVLTCRVLTNVPFTARWLRYVDDIATLVVTGEKVRQVRDSLEDLSDESSLESSSPEDADDLRDDEEFVKRSKALGSRSEEGTGGDIQQRLWQRRYDLSVELDQSSSSASSQEDENDIRLVIQDAKLSDSGRYSCLVISKHARLEKSAWLTVHAVDEVEKAYAERRQLWQKRWGADQGPEEYLRGIVIAVSVSSVLLIISVVVLFVMAVMKAYKRQDVVLHIYDLRDPDP